MFIKSATRIFKASPLKNVLRRSLASFTEEKVEVLKSEINYVRSGTGDKSVLLLPGVLGSAWTDFKPQIEQLPELLPEYTVFAMDPPGYGKSIPPTRVFNEDFYTTDAIYAQKFMEAVRVNKYSILGWSDGGITAMIAAAKYSRFIEKIVIWGANSYITPAEMEQFKKMKDITQWSPKARETYEQLYGDQFPIMFGQWVDTVEEIYQKKAGDICKHILDDIKCPTFILHGDLDPMCDKEHVPYLMKQIKNAQ